MVEDYVQNYIQAVDNPLPELKNTYDRELELLKTYTDQQSTILDVGCGAGRPANSLSEFVEKVVCIDKDDKMLQIAKERCKKTSNIEFLQDDARNLSFPDDTYDLVFATYNLIGSLQKPDRPNLVEEMRRVAKNNAKIINITWKNNKDTTAFLEKYYPSIGIDIISIDKSKVITSKGTFERLSKEELKDYYTSANLKNIEFVSVGPVWTGIIGAKEDLSGQ